MPSSTTSGSPRRARSRSAWARVRGRAASSSNSATSIEMGNAPTSTRRPSTVRPGTAPCRVEESAREHCTRFSAAPRRCIPTTSAPRIPRRISSRQGSRHEQLLRGEGDVREEPDAQVRPALAEHGRDQLQVVVVDPDDRTLARRAGGGLGEALVHAHVRRPTTPARTWERGWRRGRAARACRWRSRRSTRRPRRPRAARAPAGCRRAGTAWRRRRPDPTIPPRRPGGCGSHPAWPAPARRDWAPTASPRSRGGRAVGWPR